MSSDPNNAEPTTSAFEDPTDPEEDLDEDGDNDSNWDGFHEALDELQVRARRCLFLPNCPRFLLLIRAFKVQNKALNCFLNVENWLFLDFQSRIASVS
jgi:hypothetical protein